MSALNKHGEMPLSAAAAVGNLELLKMLGCSCIYNLSCCSRVFLYLIHELFLVEAPRGQPSKSPGVKQALRRSMRHSKRLCQLLTPCNCPKRPQLFVRDADPLAAAAARGHAAAVGVLLDLGRAANTLQPALRALQAAARIGRFA